MRRALLSLPILVVAAVLPLAAAIGAGPAGAAAESCGVRAAAPAASAAIALIAGDGP